MRTTPVALQLLPGALVNLYVNDLPKRGRAQRAPLLCVIPARHSTGSETGQERGDCAEVLGLAASAHRIPPHQDGTERAEQPEPSSAAHTGGGWSEHKGGPRLVLPPRVPQPSTYLFSLVRVSRLEREPERGRLAGTAEEQLPQHLPSQAQHRAGGKSGEIPPKPCDLASGPNSHHCCDPVM